MTEALDLIGALFIMAGSTFTLIAGIGLVRFNDLFSRTHAAAKPQMLGLMLMLVGLVLMERTWAWFAICTLVIAIQMVAAPVASHLLGRAAYITGLAESESLVLDELKEGDSNMGAEEVQGVPDGDYSSSSSSSHAE
ncbi:MAG: monovalent cation/H(+) antiporter subunit G [Scrofimicrobium sp.]